VGTYAVGDQVSLHDFVLWVSWFLGAILIIPKPLFHFYHILYFKNRYLSIFHFILFVFSPNILHSRNAYCAMNVWFLIPYSHAIFLPLVCLYAFILQQQSYLYSTHRMNVTVLPQTKDMNLFTCVWKPQKEGCS
jgi:hypothetical protein